MERSPSNVILVAVQELMGSKVVLGTFRIAWENLEVFQLFEVPTDRSWPHQRLAHKPGEAGKCSMHPLLDLLSTSCLPDLSQLGTTYKAIAFMMMWELAFVFNDLMALAAMNALRAQGIRVPEDTSILGYAHIFSVSAFEPALTTIAQPIAAIGQDCMARLLEHIHEPEKPPTHITLPVELIHRSSCRRLPGHKRSL